MNSLKDCVQTLVDSIMAMKSGPKRLLNFDPGSPGCRLFPADTPKKNKDFEVCFDIGQTHKDNPDLVAINLQINREATTKGLKDLVRQNGTHHTYATVWINAKQAATKEAADKLCDDILEQLDSSK